MRIWGILAVSLAGLALLSTKSVASDEIDVTKLPAPAKKQVDFAQEIQPIFANKCYSCHGSEEQQGGLRLDARGPAFEGGDSGRVILPGKSAESKLVHLVSGLLDFEVMPPEGTPLSEEQVALVRAWIDQGAKWPDDLAESSRRTSDHWSFQPIERPPLPEIKQRTWVRNPIDRFVLAKLEAAGIRPSPEADRETLIRRLSMDLIGLPPTPQQVESFLNDKSADAYERLVDRLLASPHYGERWGRHWLDLARYADSDGYEKDLPRKHAWRYRDWVIHALNRDLPFDQFTIQQLAGDLLPDPSTQQLVATGFHRNTLTNREGGVDRKEDFWKQTIDRTNTTGSVWMGLTVGCAQCHSHKYDPLTQREYYGLYAFFNQVTEKNIPAPPPELQEEYQRKKQKFDQAHAALKAKLHQAAQSPEVQQRQREWEAKIAKTAPVWQVLTPQSVKSKAGAELKVLKDGSVLASGKNPDKDLYTFTATTQVEGITAIRLEVLPDNSLGGKGPGRTPHGNFVLSELELTAKSAGGKPQAVQFQQPQADFSQESWAVAGAIDGKTDTGWAISPQMGKPHVALFETKTDLGTQGTTELAFRLNQQYGKQHTLGRFRLSVTSMPRPVGMSAPPPEIVTIVNLPREKRTPTQTKQLDAYYQTVDPKLSELRQQVAAHAKKAPQDPGKEYLAQALFENPNAGPTKLFIRGDFLQESDIVIPSDTPEVLPPLEARDKQADRLDLARWLVDPEHPLTSRVTVNRIWQRYFGRGLVASVDDFGTQGEKPTHPELLDWLASEFMAQGWSMKKLHKLIVTSATYRQSSHARPELENRDPYNTLLARQNRLRVEAEIIRDVALAASGLLVPEIGGPSVRPPQPEGLAQLGYANSVKWQTSQGDDRYRRGLYTFFQRTVPYPMLMTFDAPDSTVTCTRRERSNTPLQALTLWNDPVFFECCQAMGRRIVEEAPNKADAQQQLRARLNYAVQLCLNRSASQQELDILQQLYQEQRDLYENHPQDAEAFVGPRQRPEQVSLPELAAWVMIGRTLMNLDEFITRE